MKIITRTAWGSALQSALLHGKAPNILANTTLNEKFGILSGSALASTDRPSMKYFCIGNGGHANRVGGDGFQYNAPINHRAVDAALYRHLPFVLRPIDNDLTVTERARYALRRMETHANAQYFAYYLKRIIMTDVTTIIEHTVVDGDTSVSSQYIPNLGNLNPTPPEMPSVGVISTSGDYISTAAILPLVFGAQDVLELIEACRIKFGNEAYAIISEIGLVSGVDKTVPVAGEGNTQFNMLEVIGAQINSFITTHHSVAFTNQGFVQDIEIGATDPMLSEADVVTAGVLPTA